ncbi:hypothetical protein [Elioraea sp.]|uniref:hypothetical protein n=1 Tax=Elioraea sp. TaxID=2185103 RepID=UPI0021DCE2EB|nr:hypothetical protein [Elioraea sp.]GIX09157.1 MAG: hypothetical protein KatS3mg116_0867 [Elioraea sp.]
MRRRVGLVLVAGLAALPAAAQQGTMLDAVGGSLWPRGGGADSKVGGQSGAGLLDGTLRLDFGPGFTAQGEAQGGAYGGSDGTGGRLQLWWANEALGLAGVFAERGEKNRLMQRRIGARGELHLGPFTLRGETGYVVGDRAATGQVRPGLFGTAALSFYQSDDLGFTGGIGGQNGRGVGFANVEWAPPFLPRNMALTLDGASGAGGFLIGLVGIRLTFGAGAEAPLRQRQMGRMPGFPSYDPAAFGGVRRPDPPLPPSSEDCPVTTSC